MMDFLPIKAIFLYSGQSHSRLLFEQQQQHPPPHHHHHQHRSNNNNTRRTYRALSEIQSGLQLKNIQSAKKHP